MLDTVLAQQILDGSVHKVVGRADVSPRPGQQALFEDICRAMSVTGALAGSAPTGSGKSLAALAPAFAAAVEGERTILSTESLALQDQIVGKDAPLVASVCEEITGIHPTVRLLKGWGNYACLLRASDLAVRTYGADDDSLEEQADTVRAKMPALAWVLSMAGNGEKSSCPEEMPPNLWPNVVIAADDCMGERCPFVDICYPRRAREEAAQAQIVVTNHATLGTQVAKNVPAVMGRANEVHPFSHIIIDECHALPDVIRSTGSDSFSARRFSALLSRWEKTLRRFNGLEAHLVPKGQRLAAAVAAELEGWRDQIGEDGYRNLAEHEDALPMSGEALVEWIADARKNTERVRKRYAEAPEKELVLKQLSRSLVAAGETVTNVCEPEGSLARWVALSGAEVEIAISPVDVANLCRNRLWSYSPSGADLDDEPVRLTSICMSATLGEGFAQEVGLDIEQTSYPSPFRDSYDNSALFYPGMPKGSPAARAVMTKGRFDVDAHAKWCRPIISSLVDANDGNALVLSVTVDAGKAYAEELAKRHTVYTQWDGRALRQVVADWKANPGSVMVGTKSLMTGVDAPGDGCSLVIVDRVPRKPINPLDEARVQLLTGGKGNLWAGRSKVYAADAAKLLAQAAGRLIRTGTDYGMVAVLDPRLWPDADNAFRSNDRRAYLDALGFFSESNHLSTHGAATRWLSKRRKNRNHHE